MTDQLDLSIIIINWNSATFVRKCLASIHANTKGLAFEAIVVDNASFDSCEEIVRREFPGTRFIQNKENIGFARANNLAFSHSSGRNILFLNPDTQVVGPALQGMLSCLESTPDAGIVGAKLLNSDLSIQTSCIRRFPTILNQALGAECLRRLFPKSPLWGMRPLFENEDAPAQVEAISGACMMIKKNVFEEVGLFSADYFMYSEDMDLCYRVTQAGWKIYYVPDGIVIHYGGGSTRSRAADHHAVIMMKESQLKFMRMHRGRFYAAAYRLTMTLVAVCRLTVLCGLLVVTMTRVQRQAVQLAFAKWARVFRWAIGFKGSAKRVT